MSRRGCWVVGGAATAVILGVGASAAVAEPGLAISGMAPVNVDVVQGSMHPGGTVTVTGRGWAPLRAVSIVVSGRTSRVAADAAGRFSVRVLVPWQTVPGVVTVRVAQGASVASDRLRVGVDWRMAGGDKAHSFVNPYEKQLTRTSVSELTPGWRLSFPGSDYDANAFASIATLGGFGYGCTLSGDVAKFDLATGRVLWRFFDENPDKIQFCSDSGSAYLADDGVVWFGKLRLNAATGELVVGDDRSDVTIPFAGTLITGGSSTVDAPLQALDATTGALLWSAPAGLRDATLLSTGVVYHHDADALYATDAASGRNLWVKQFPLSIADLASNGKALLGRTHLTESDGEHVARLDPDTGGIQWAVDVDGLVTPLTVSADAVYFVRLDFEKPGRFLTALDLSGKQLWSTALDGGSLDQVRPVLANGVIYLPVAGGLATYDAATGAKLGSVTSLVDAFGHKIAPGTAVVDDGHVYLTSFSGIYELHLP